MAQKLQLDGQLAYLMLDNAPLLTALHNAEQKTPLTSSLDLASRGYYDPAKWQPLIGTSIPTQIPGATAAAQSTNYANLLAAHVRLAFPTAVVSNLVSQSKLPIQGTADVATGVTTFLTSNQGQFEIGIEPVEAYIARSKIAGTPAPVVEQIKRLQRVYQLTPDDQSMAVLLQANLDSAYAITRYDAAGFAQAFQNQLGSAQAATAIHARATQIYGSVLDIVTHYLAAQRADLGRCGEHADRQSTIKPGGQSELSGRRLSDARDPLRVDGLLPVRRLPLDPEPRGVPGRSRCTTSTARRRKPAFRIRRPSCSAAVPTFSTCCSPAPTPIRSCPISTSSTKRSKRSSATSSR